MSFANVGKSWDVTKFEAYLATLTRPSWAKAVVLHHTAAPNLRTRPVGLTDQHIRNIQDFYMNDKGWSAGPHLFVDDHRIMGMTPLTEKGVHAVSFNSSAIGIEVLGDYDTEDPKSGRGFEAWTNAAAATNILLAWLKLTPSDKTVLFHRNDPRTDKSCPGKLITKDWVLHLMTTLRSAGPAPITLPRHCPTCICPGHA